MNELNANGLDTSFQMQQYRNNFERLCEKVKTEGWGSLFDEVVSERDGVVVSRFGDDRWDWSQYAMSKSALSKGGSVSGYIKFSNISSLAIRNEVKLAAYGWMFYVSGRYGKESNVAMIGARCEISLGSVAKFLAEREADSLSEMSEVNTWRKFTDFIKQKEISFSTCIQITSTLRALSVLSPHLPFYCQTVEKKPAEWSRKVSVAGSEKTQTIAIPLRIAEVVYGEAVRLIEDAFEHVDLIEQARQQEWDAYCLGAAVAESMIARGEIKKPGNDHGYSHLAWRYAPRKRGDIINSSLKPTGWVPQGDLTGEWFSRFATNLQTAAFICLTGFTGMRDSEVFGVRNDSFVSANVGGVTIELVQSIHEKLTKGGKVEEWVACPIVGKAIRVASSLVKHMQTQWENERVRLMQDGDLHNARIASMVSGLLWLRQVSRNVLPNYRTSGGFNSSLKMFVNALGEHGLVTQEDFNEATKNNPHSIGKIKETIRIGEPWPLAKHQMRRTFALFVVKNKLGHPIALKQQFKHIYLKMTEWYSNGAMQARVRDIKQDSKLNGLVNDVLMEQTTGIIVDAANGKAGGGFSKVIQSDPTIYGSWDTVYALVKQGRLSLSGTAHGYCKNGYQCDMDGAVNPAFCVPCENSLISAEKMEWWARKHETLVTFISDKTLSRHESSHFLTQIRAAESVMLAAGLPFTKYQSEIKVVQL